MNSILNLVGGKFRMRNEIISIFPSDHKHYVEPFFGAGWVFFHKPQSPIETINDINHNIYTLFKVIRDRPVELMEKLRWTMYEDEDRKDCIRKLQRTDIDEVERARCYFLVIRSSLSGIESNGQNIQCSKLASSRGMAMKTSAFLSAIDLLYVIADRLRTVQILCRDALKVMKKFDSDETLMYLDPPYFPYVRSGKLYAHEFGKEDHRRMLELAREMKSKIVISGYENPLYCRLLRGWKYKFVNSKVSAPSPKRGGRPNRVERIWYNF